MQRLMKEHDVVATARQRGPIEISREIADAIAESARLGFFACDVQRCERAVERVDRFRDATLDQLALERPGAASDRQRALERAMPGLLLQPLNRPEQCAAADHRVDAMTDAEI